MKKIVYILLAAMPVFLTASCSSDDNNSNSAEYYQNNLTGTFAHSDTLKNANGGDSILVNTLTLNADLSGKQTLSTISGEMSKDSTIDFTWSASKWYIATVSTVGGNRNNVYNLNGNALTLYSDSTAAAKATILYSTPGSTKYVLYRK
jgi:hypothetical protein